MGGETSAERLARIDAERASEDRDCCGPSREERAAITHAANRPNIVSELTKDARPLHDAPASASGTQGVPAKGPRDSMRSTPSAIPAAQAMVAPAAHPIPPKGRAFIPQRGNDWNALQAYPRNAPCLCGSNIKFKKCCRDKLAKTLPVKDAAKAREFMRQVKEAEHDARHPRGKNGT